MLAAVELLNAAAMALYTEGTRTGLLSIVAMSASLHSFVTALLAAWLLRERLQTVQRTGVALATFAVMRWRAEVEALSGPTHHGISRRQRTATTDALDYARKPRHPAGVATRTGIGEISIRDVNRQLRPRRGQQEHALRRSRDDESSTRPLSAGRDSAHHRVPSDATSPKAALVCQKLTGEPADT